MKNSIQRMNYANRELFSLQRHGSGGAEKRTDGSGVTYGTGRSGYESPNLSILRFESEPILDPSVGETFSSGLLEDESDW